MTLKKFSANYSDAVYGKKDNPVIAGLKQTIQDYSNDRPRSQQIDIGPSGAGVECDRRLVAALTGMDGGDSVAAWAPLTGVAVHALLADVLAFDNKRNPGTWLIEEDLEIHPPYVPRGSLDAFHIPSGTVIDYKYVGKTTLDSVRANGPSDVYRKQIMIYGYGLAKKGYQVNTCIIWYLPTTVNPHLPFLAESNPYEMLFDIDLAIDTLKHVDEMGIKAKELGVKNNPKKLTLVPAQPSPANCMWCPINGSLCKEGVKS